jgi:lipopolysaccharide biosynthesis protein
VEIEETMLLNFFSRSNRNDKWCPEESYSQTPRSEIQPKLAILVHVFYADLVDDLIQKLKAVGLQYDLYLSFAEHLDVDSCIEKFSQLKPNKCHWIRVRNRGRDIYPFLLWLNSKFFKEYEIFLKIHTKRSAWVKNARHIPLGVENGDQWREVMLNQLIGDSNEISKYVRLLSSNNDIGIVCPSNTNLSLINYMGGNLKMMNRLASKLSLSIPELCTFPAGSMYWARCSAVRQLSMITPVFRKFSKETGQDDGTFAHAIERFVGVVTASNKLRIIETSDPESQVIES